MIDEEKQATFAGDKLHYSVVLCMREKELQIKVVDNQTLRKFSTTISHQFIDRQDKFFTSYFETPEDVFIYLTQRFSQLLIENGSLKFSYPSGLKQQMRDVVVELEKEQGDEKALAELKTVKMKELFSTQLQQRDERIAALQLGLREIVNEFRQYKRENVDRQRQDQQRMNKMEGKLQNEENHTKKLEERLQRQERNNKNLEDRLQKEEERSKNLELRLQKEENRSKDLEERLKGDKISKDLEEMMQRTEAISSKIASPSQVISHHPENSHKMYYALTNSTSISAKITKVNEGEYYYNFVNQTEVLPKQYNKYAVKLIKVKKSDLQIGFCTGKGLGSTNNYNKPESVYYYCVDKGYLYQEGACKDLVDCGSVSGDLVECLIDLLEGRIRWWKGEKVLAECNVPASMKGKPLFLSIIFAYDGDSAEITSA